MANSNKDKAEVALHQRIRDDVEQKIMSGEWGPARRIPMEREFMVQYGCSRMTVVKAISSLAQAGLIHRRRRVGSFVAQPRHHMAVLEIPDIRADVLGRGLSYGLKLNARRIRAPTKLERGEMVLEPDARLLDLQCVHNADGEPFASEARVINLGAVPEAAKTDFSLTPPGSWLLAHVPWTEARHRITAIPADAAVAADLRLEPGAACLRLERWTWRGDDTITYVRQIFPGRQYDLIARFSAASEPRSPGSAP